ncbi:GNAT family N-acetyltransferase [Actinobacteria bacterium YIM 96077]|uniref:GNAT family N-acetyltransferase n=1 Tax=Phytoactinopolyspora halophila TaxID=1981511 RepID=A0A329QBR6_9ACTN|nr:GNAT family N-acetyltransferase [Phytoactinopolyspora halophila]AYY12508.1 GNAT family N-acetyltransferase [Actinobacteria bacterium YIM 96077]RAW09431.1 GNAT family N-acetyltransferase [Phytoactinopolyspora halophila]
MTGTNQSVTVRPLGAGDDQAVRGLLADSWSEAAVAAHGVVYDATQLPGFIAEVRDQLAGLLTYHTDGDEWEIVTLDATVAGRGVGTALLRTAEEAARRAGASRLWLITTNENVHAIRFYQRRGFDLVAVHRDAVTRARAELKPSIPVEVDGIPLRHELEFERQLT